ncbi:hypothetical protein LTR56_005793 [Elasticomyces elasticus]|nr:hypothetical protein LTR22_019449 [Elasticomyces elasticus]KAK3651336.1 hypothetical protein LTR56_005793 [Elasticomyces elasticus]KAK4925724.1 hypothetical protein LTR49_007334 [Elasticomyces elasticus]KAK5765056.1 hypothetical protein LTS12_004834 [Elasticomyces elasticus]
MYETTSSALDGQATVTQSTIRWKRSIPSAVPQYHRVANVPPNAAVILGYHELPIDRASNGSEPAHVASRMQMLKRQQVQPYASPIPTLGSLLVGWPACLVSQACAQVATGVLATTISTSIPTSTAVVTQTTTETYATASCVAPAEDPAYTAFTPIWGAWNGDSMDPNNPNGGAYMVETAIQLPFSICLGGYCSSVLTVGTDGYVYYNDDATSTQIYLSIYSGQGFGSSNTVGGCYAIVSAPNNFYDCIPRYSGDGSQCKGYVYFAGAFNGNGPGNCCFLDYSPQSFARGSGFGGQNANTTVGVLKTEFYGGPY